MPDEQPHPPQAIPPPPVAPGTPLDPKDHRVGHIDPLRQSIWDHVSQSPLGNLWNFQGAPVKTVLQRTAKSFMEDNLLSRAAELGFYFLFALFPTLVCASSILGLAARSASAIYLRLLDYLAIVIPHSAFSMVLDTFNQTTSSATSGKLTLGLVAALWSASVGFSAIQDSMNTVYKVKETRSYFGARLSAILVTLLLAVMVTGILATLLAGDFVAVHAGMWMRLDEHSHYISWSTAAAARTISWLIAAVLLMLLFSTVYYLAPDIEKKRWHWFTPGAATGLLGWLFASMGLRAYMHYFDNYSVTYGSLGGVIVLLTWFYVTGLALLVGAEINSEIQAAVAEKKLKEKGVLPPEATTDAAHPVTPEA
jgi:membrane protein